MTAALVQHVGKYEVSAGIWHLSPDERLAFMTRVRIVLQSSMRVWCEGEDQGQDQGQRQGRGQGSSVWGQAQGRGQARIWGTVELRVWGRVRVRVDSGSASSQM